MRYLVHLKNKIKTLYFWEEEKTHTTFAFENGICLEEVSSVGYVLYNPNKKKWILTGAVSWICDANVNADKRHILRHIQKHLNTDEELKKRLSEHWELTQKKNAEIIKKNPQLAVFFKNQGKEME